MTLIDKLSKEHCWRIESDFRTRIVYTEKDLKSEIEIFKELSIDFIINQLW